MAEMNTERQNRTIQRTICVGLGGTGRDVLMRIRRQIIDRYGSLSELPVVSFVHIDTDTAASKSSGLRTGSTYHGEDILFRDAETVEATMNQNQVNNFVQGVEKKSKYSDQINPYDHIASWFPPQLIKDLNAITKGANAIRPVGRLAFFNNYRRIKEAIEMADNRNRGYDEKLLQKGLIVESGLNIFVVGSLCGGTGSGMFLDTAYTLRHIFGSQGGKFFGYFIISPELYRKSQDDPRKNANTYSALKELNHYTTPGTEFVACYDPQNSVNIQEDRPPFDFTYLVSNQTSDGSYKILEQSKLCNIIAHKIFLDFVGELSPTIQGLRNNISSHLPDFDRHPRPNTQSYMTFGLAEIYFPRDKIIQVAWKHISVKVVQFWLYGIGQSPDAKDLLESFLSDFWKTTVTNKDYFSIKLQEITQEGNNTFSKTIKTWINQLERSIDETEKKEERQNIIHQLPDKFKKQFRTIQTGESETTRGIWLTLLQQTRVNLTEKLKEDIDSYFANLLNPANDKFSVNNSRSWLQALKTKLNDYQNYLEDKKQNFKKVSDLDDINKKWQDTMQIIAEIEKKGNFLFPQEKKKKNQFQQEISRVIREIADMIKRNFDFTATEEALEIVKSLQQHVQKLDSKSTNFNQFTKDLISVYEKEEEEQKQLNLDEMSGQAIFTKDDLEDCYKKLIPQEERQSQLMLISENIVKKLANNNSLISLATRDILDIQEIKEELNKTIEQMFGTQTLNIVQSVIKRFMQKYLTTSERINRLEQIIKESDLLLPLSLSDPYFYNDPGKNEKIIGFKNADTQEVANLKSILTRDLGISETVLKPIQAEDEIILVQEYGGFPLRILNNIKYLQQHYLRLKDNGNHLHNESVIFTDILPPDAAEIERLQDILYPCIAFKIITKNANEMFEFEYYDRLMETTEIILISNIWTQALEQLANFQNLSSQLDDKIKKLIESFIFNKELWKKYKGQLQEFIKEIRGLEKTDPNYPYKDKVGGTGQFESFDTPYQEGVLARFMNKIDNTLQEKFKEFEKQKQANNQSLGYNNNEKYLPKSSIIEPEIVDNSNNINPDSKMDKLRELVQMKKEGFLTEEEFNAAKKRILGI